MKKESKITVFFKLPADTPFGEMIFTVSADVWPTRYEYDRERMETLEDPAHVCLSAVSLGSAPIKISALDTPTIAILEAAAIEHAAKVYEDARQLTCNFS